MSLNFSLHITFFYNQLTCLLRSFAYNVLSDFVRYSITSQDKADKLFPTILPILITAISTLNLDLEVRSNCILAITTAVDISPSCFINYVDPSKFIEDIELIIT